MTARYVVMSQPKINCIPVKAACTSIAAVPHPPLVEPLGFSLDEREVRRAGLDYWERVRPAVWASWEALERRLPELGEPFFFSSEAGRSLWNVDFPEAAVLVFGRESSGLPLRLRRRYP